MIRVGYKYPVKFVKKRVVKGKTITNFSLSSKVKNSTPTSYQNYQFTVWKNIDLEDGDHVLLKTLDSVSANTYNGKTYQNISGTVEIIKIDHTETGYAEEDAPMPTPAPEPEKPVEDPGFFPADDETALPFDL